MLKNIPKSLELRMGASNKDLKTYAYVLRRTNYGEADRILNLITPDGKISAVAKGVRKEKSKLAGGIEMFSLIEVNIHQGKSDMGVVTSSRMIKFYGNILADLGRLEFASLVLKKVGVAAEGTDNPDYFRIVDQVLVAVNKGVSLELTEAWFWFNFAKAGGEEINLYRDVDGRKLDAGVRYEWDYAENALVARQSGMINADAIKFMRMLLVSNMDVVAKVKNIDAFIPKVLMIGRAVNRV